ncbi:Restriction endonuclease [Mesobacillus persicus]|uniref:Restriction endonuclease n=1 Tax=Mesobacillus persicus TaxID=930146 RepID=A0A1H8JKF6_9BACI|nr:restriction endonuclease [Mesobacillus persicus]SEN80995.1 Restriction endonuclease [Mesobacillus persicus]
MKAKRKSRKDFDKHIISGIMLFCWFFTTADYIKEIPSDVSTGVFLLSLPFLVGLTNKRFRKFVIRMILVFIKSFRYKSGLPVDLKKVDTMAGLEFERFLKPVFERQGYLADVTQGSGDYGADLILRKGRKKYVVQAKRYNSNIGVSAVQQVVAAVSFYRAHGAIVVTNRYFTPAARELAMVNEVRLIDRDELTKLLC